MASQDKLIRIAMKKVLTLYLSGIMYKNTQKSFYVSHWD